MVGPPDSTTGFTIDSKGQIYNGGVPIPGARSLFGAKEEPDATGNNGPAPGTPGTPGTTATPGVDNGGNTQ